VHPASLSLILEVWSAVSVIGNSDWLGHYELDRVSRRFALDAALFHDIAARFDIVIRIFTNLGGILLG